MKYRSAAHGRIALALALVSGFVVACSSSRDPSKTSKERAREDEVAPAPPFLAALNFPGVPPLPVAHDDATCVVYSWSRSEDPAQWSQSEVRVVQPGRVIEFESSRYELSGDGSLLHIDHGGSRPRSFDAQGNSTSVGGFEDGIYRVRLSEDAAGRLIKIQGDNGSRKRPVLELAYDPVGRIRSVTYPIVFGAKDFFVDTHAYRDNAELAQVETRAEDASEVAVLRRFYYGPDGLLGYDIDGTIRRGGPIADGIVDARVSYMYESSEIRARTRDGVHGSAAPDGSPDEVRVFSRFCDGIGADFPEIYDFPTLNLMARLRKTWRKAQR